MKKIILLLIFNYVSLFVIGSDGLDDEVNGLTFNPILMNLEALYSGELDDENWSCLSVGTLDCPRSAIKVKIIMGQ